MKKKSPIKLLIILCIIVFLTITFIVLSMVLKEDLAPEDSEASYHSHVFSDLSFKQQLEVKNPTEFAQNDYPLSVRVTDPNIISKFGQDDCSDIAFTDKNGKKLSHYLYKCRKDGSSPLVVAYVKVSKLMKKNEANQDIYMYYGNNNKEYNSLSSGKDTFDYYEDFEEFNPTISFGLITDIHHDTNDYVRWEEPDFEIAHLGNALPRFSAFINEMNKWNPDFVISLGDLITSENWGKRGRTNLQDIIPHSDPRYSLETAVEAGKALREAENAYQNFNGPRYYVHSNHEYYSLEKSEIKEIIGGQGAVKTNESSNKNPYFSFSAGGIKFIGLDLQSTIKDESGYYGEGFMSDGQLQWFDNEIKISNEPVIIFSPMRIDEVDYFDEGECSNEILLPLYCTDDACQTNPASCASNCADFYRYRTAKNIQDIRNILENKQNSSKILAVFQGNDHHSAYSTSNGIHYISVNGATQGNVQDVNHLKVEIDADRQLIQLTSGGIGENGSEVSKYAINYKNGKMILKNESPSKFLSAILPMNIELDNTSNYILEGEWAISNLEGQAINEPSQQIAMGFLKDADHINLRHRCAADGRDRFYNIAGIRRVRAKTGGFIGSQFAFDGNSTPNLEVQSNDNNGNFWMYYNASKKHVKSWFSTDSKSGKAFDYSYDLEGFSPNTWVWDDTIGEIDQIILRKTVKDSNDAEPYVIFGDLE